MSYTNQRTAYGDTLLELCRQNRNIVVLDADLGGSTQGKKIEQALPEQHLEMGIAEANMASVAGGLSRVGKIPFINSFSVFCCGRAYDQLRQSIAIGKLNVKICGSSAGCSDFGDGATHQSVDDIAYMRVIPNMQVIVPADANEAVEVTKYMAASQGPVYMRLNRNDYPNVTPEGQPFVLGRPTVLREGSDVCVFACGIMVGKALEAAEQLEGQISVKVVNVSTIKPRTAQAIVELARDCRGVVTAEEHSVIGGLGGAIAEALCKACKPIEFVGIQDRFGSSAHSYGDILEYMGLTTARIEEAVRAVAAL